MSRFLKDSMGTVVVWLALTAMAHAHFPWLVVADGQARLYFAEHAASGDAALLDSLAGASVWQRDSKGRDTPVELKIDGDHSSSAVASGSKIVFLRKTYGLLERGGESFLLDYGAKVHTSPLPGEWKAVDDAEKLPLEVLASVTDDRLRLNVVWKGTPSSRTEVHISIDGATASKVETDEQGSVDVPIERSGLYSIRAKRIDPTSGEHAGKKYSSIRHWTTLTLPVTLANIMAEERSFPELPHGVTSFGGAVIGDFFFAYGGYLEAAHHYYDDGQSKRLLRISISRPTEWEEVAQGPPRTGTALVGHQRRLIRVGGFLAKNKEFEEQNLESQADVQAFDPSTHEWSDLPRLPAGRSSHDAVLVGDTLFVVGGWNMSKGSAQGGGETNWHETAIALDLTDAKATWRMIAPPPFKRRALSLAGHAGKLFVIGGMQEQGGPTTEVAVYDPRTDEWGTAGKLLGGPMEGFGTAACEAEGKLFVTTMSGAVQQFDDATGAWKLVGQLRHARFFHRIAPIDSGRILVVGGASMETGKVTQVETFGTKTRE